MRSPEHSVHYIEFVTEDVVSMRDLYSKAFGWQFHSTPELGNAYVAGIPGGLSVGIRAPMSDDEKPTVRMYVRVDDIKTAVQGITTMGATVLLDHMEIPGKGIIAIYEHGGIQHGLWQIPESTVA